MLVECPYSFPSVKLALWVSVLRAASHRVLPGVKLLHQNDLGCNCAYHNDHMNLRPSFCLGDLDRNFLFGSFAWAN